MGSKDWKANSSKHLGAVVSKMKTCLYKWVCVWKWEMRDTEVRTKRKSAPHCRCIHGSSSAHYAYNLWPLYILVKEVAELLWKCNSDRNTGLQKYYYAVDGDIIRRNSTQVRDTLSWCSGKEQRNKASTHLCVLRHNVGSLTLCTNT